MPDDTNTSDTPAPKKRARRPSSPKTPGQSVAATRLVRKARRRGFGKGAGEGIVFFGGVDKRTTKGGRDKMTLNLVAQAFAINVSADVPVDAASRALLVWWRSCILTGHKPDGSAQVPLSKAAMARGDRLTPYRGAKTGELADGLRRSAISGTTTKARCTIQPPTNRNVFIAGELARNVKYLGLGGEADEVIRLAVQEWLSAAIENKVRSANTEPLVAEKADT